MESLVGYGSDDDKEMERYRYQQPSGSSGAPGGSRRRDDDTNYDDVNMDLSEESQESEPELPQAEEPRRRDEEASRSKSREQDRDRRDKRRESPRRDRRDRRDDRKHERTRSRERSRGYEPPKRGLLGDRPQDRDRDNKVPPLLMDIKTNIGESSHKSQDARDAVSPRFVDRDRRDRDRDRERSERDRDRHGRRSPDRRSGSSRHGEREGRSRSRGNYPTSGHSSGSSERRNSPPSSSGDYRPSSYKVNKKLEVMEKMGLQIKTPDGSMATASQLRAAAAPGLPPTYNPANLTTNKILDQKRKLLWSSKKSTECTEAAKWSGAKFSQDTDGKQANKFMRLMGIKDASALKPENTDKVADPIKKQEELFQAMQAQYEVARATTHTMRGVGLGFQKSQF